jgi:hypothetical protein
LDKAPYFGFGLDNAPGKFDEEGFVAKVMLDFPDDFRRRIGRKMQIPVRLEPVNGF